MKAIYWQTLTGWLVSAIFSVLESKDFVQGPTVERFTKNFSIAQGSKFTVGCANGTSAITVALRALNVGPGGEVITVANSFFSTPEAIA